MGFRVRAIPTAERRPAGGALYSRSLQQLPSPTRPTSIGTLFVEFALRCQLGVLNLERVLPSRFRTGYRCFPATSLLARAAVARTVRMGANPVRQLSSFSPAVNYDCAMARTLRRLPRAAEVESPAFGQRPQQPSVFELATTFGQVQVPAFQIRISISSHSAEGLRGRHRLL